MKLIKNKPGQNATSNSISKKIMSYIEDPSKFEINSFVGDSFKNHIKLPQNFI